MLGLMLRFELKYHFSQITFKAAAVLFFVLGLLAVQGSYGGDQVHKNAPYVMTTLIALLSMSSIFVSTILCAGAVMRDASYKMESILFTTSVRKLPYFLTRFTGLVLSVFIVLALAAAGLLLGSLFAPGGERGPYDLLYFVQPLVVFGFPNILFSASLIFCAALLTQNTRAVYATGLLLYVLYLSASILGNSPLLATSSLKVLQPDALPLLLDPFGLASFFSHTRSWTDFQRNTLLFPLTKEFLFNRLLWSALSLLALVAAYRFFSFRISIPKSVRKHIRSQKSGPPATYRRFKVSPQGFGYNVSGFFSQLRLELQSLFGHIPFMVMLLLWIFIFTIELKDSLFSGPYGINFYPQTGIIIEELRSVRPAALLIIFYAAELLWREKTDRIADLIFSTPVPGSVLWTAKCTVLLLLCAVLVTANIFVGIGIQLFNGHYALQLPVYLSLYYYSAVPLILLSLLFIFIQTLIPDKYLGILLSVAAAFVISFSARLGIEHYLLRFASVPSLSYSSFNGFGHYSRAFHGYMLYWGGLCALLSFLAAAFFKPMRAANWAEACKSIDFLKGKYQRLTCLSFLLIWMSTGIYIYYQTNVKGHYQSTNAEILWRMDYEKKYKQFSGLTQPVIKSVKTNVALYPGEGIYTVKGSYLLKNESDTAVRQIWAGIDPQVSSANISISEPADKTLDSRFGQYWFYLKDPVLPGAVLKMDFEIIVNRSGFTAFNSENSVVENGSYIEMEKYVPALGYNPGFEARDENARKGYGLAPRHMETSPDLAYHLIDFETTISTAADQHVVTVGTLKRSWSQNERRYFQYKTSQPTGFMFALSSAKYAVFKQRYKQVELSVYYHPGQDQNLPAILQAMKNTLDYCTANFAPYPLKTLTLAEIPQYPGAATAYPGVVFSAERINFLGDFSNKDKINQSYAITAHEVSHQWWANLLSPVQGPGRNFLTESLAKYTEAMVLKKHYGSQQLRNYLEMENNLYFALRNSDGKELPLLQSIDQPFVYYQKGVLAMNALQHGLGEKKLNQALSELIKSHAAPRLKATPEDFTRKLYRSASVHEKKWMDELLKKVISFDLGIQVVSCERTATGKYLLTLQVHTAKNFGDLPGSEPADDAFEIAVFSQLPNSIRRPFARTKYHFTKTNTLLTLILDKKPETVQIDPDILVLDNNRLDNTASVSR